MRRRPRSASIGIRGGRPRQAQVETPRPRYACLFDWTDQAMKTIKGSVERVDGAAEVARSKYGVSLEHVYWTMGEHDILGIFEAPHEESISAFLLELGSLGNVRSTTMRAFDREEMASIIGRAG